MTRFYILPLTAAGVTAASMAIIGWGTSGIAMMGPRAGVRIATLVPQVEVTLLFVVGLCVWVQLLSAESAPAFRTAVAVTSRGGVWRIWGAAARQLTTVLVCLGCCAVIWIVASLTGFGPALAKVMEVRVLLLAFAIFAIGLALCSRAVLVSEPAAIGVVCLILLVMAGSPLLIAPVISIAGPRHALVQAAMLCNPWIVAAGISGLDLLHMQWIYALSPLGSVESYYPDLITAVVVYSASGAALLFSAELALRKPIH